MNDETVQRREIHTDIDPTEPARRAAVQEINSNPRTRAELEQLHPSDVYDTKELCDKFTVEQFLAPLVAVVRKSDGAYGFLMFQHNPRFYFNFRHFRK